MASTQQDHALLLSAPDPVEAAMACDLLADQGIPSLLHGQDRDFADLGAAVHGALTRPDLYVPRGALEHAQSILKQAWDGAALTDEIALDAPVTVESEARADRTRLSTFLFVALVLAIFALLMRDYFFAGSS